jgi:hypothetical protein
MTPEYLELRDSSLHGTGVFTLKSFKKDDLVFNGERQVVEVNNPHEIIRYVDGRAVIPAIHCPQVSETTYHLYTFDSFMNHSDNPNTRVVYIDDKYYYHVATCDIFANEELTVDYGEVYDIKYPDLNMQKENS